MARTSRRRRRPRARCTWSTSTPAWSPKPRPTRSCPRSPARPRTSCGRSCRPQRRSRRPHLVRPGHLHGRQPRAHVPEPRRDARRADSPASSGARPSLGSLAAAAVSLLRAGHLHRSPHVRPRGRRAGPAELSRCLRHRAPGGARRDVRARLAGAEQGNGVVGSTSNILAFVLGKVDEAIARGDQANLRFILGTEAGMITPIVRQVQAQLRDYASEGGLSCRRRSSSRSPAKRSRKTSRAGSGSCRALRAVRAAPRQAAARPAHT